MDKNRISNHNWICRTLTGTIALEATPMPLKQRNFLKQLSKPARVSELYKILKDKYPNDYNKTSDFVEIVDFTNKKIWIEKVEQPQIVAENEKDNSEDISIDDSRDAPSLPEDILNLSRKAQSGYSEESEVFSVEFENKQDKPEEIQKWIDEEAEYEEQVVEFIPDQKTKDLILKLGLGTVEENDVNDLELPEEDPFSYKPMNIPQTEAAVQVLQYLDQFEGTDENSNEIEVKDDDIVKEKENIIEIENNTSVVLTTQEKENKRLERLNKRTINPIKTNNNKKQKGILGSLKNSFKKIIGK